MHNQLQQHHQGMTFHRLYHLSNRIRRRAIETVASLAVTSRTRAEA